MNQLISTLLHIIYVCIVLCINCITKILIKELTKEFIFTLLSAICIE